MNNAEINTIHRFEPRPLNYTVSSLARTAALHAALCLPHASSWHAARPPASTRVQ